MPEPNSWTEVKRLFNEALPLDAAERARYLDHNCGSDRKFRAEIESLLAQNDEAGNFMREPLVGAVPHPVPDLLSVETLVKGRYRVERKLSQGGFGAVFLARDENLHDKKVVIKVLLPVGSRDATWIESKFQQEIRALSLIDHPAVVGIYDSGFLPDERPFFVMQYVDGRPLRDLMPPDGMPLRQVALIAEQIGQALGAAHEKGIWHRDLKPNNIMIQSGPEKALIVRLIDFGIATINDRPNAGSVTQIVGTLRYMSPEQLEGRVNRATDVYAFGVIVYEMLTGRTPFSAENPVILRKQQEAGLIVTLSPPGSAVLTETERLIRRALSLNPEDRPVSAAQFGRELGRSLALPTAPSPILRRRSVLAGAIGAVALVSGVFWASTRSGEPAAIRLSLSLLVQPMRDNQPNGNPSLLPASGTLHPLDAFTLLIQTTERGHIYVLNEDENAGTLNTLFPAPFMYGGSSAVGSEEVRQIPEGSRYRLDPQSSRETLWLVWSRSPIPEFESLKYWINPVDRGAVRAESDRSRIHNFLVEAARNQKSSPKSAGTKLAISGVGSRLVWKLPLAVMPEPEPRK